MRCHLPGSSSARNATLFGGHNLKIATALDLSVAAPSTRAIDVVTGREAFGDANTVLLTIYFSKEKIQC